MILDRSHNRGLHLWLKCRTGRSRRANLFVSTKCIKQSGQIVTLHRRANKWTQKAQPYLVPSCTPGSAQGDAGSNRKRSSTTFRTKSFDHNWRMYVDSEVAHAKFKLYACPEPESQARPAPGPAQPQAGPCAVCEIQSQRPGLQEYRSHDLS